MILLVLFVSLVLFRGIHYTGRLFEHKQKAFQTVNTSGPIYKTCSKEAALAVAKEWNPALTFGVQKEAAYKIADAVYNAAPAHQASVLGAAIPGLSSAKEANLPASRKTIAVDANGKRTSAFGTPPVIIALENDCIKVTTDNDVAYAVPAQCNVDVVLAVPTNADASLADIKTACANFIEDNFYYTRGVYFSIIPYSGKLSIPSGRRATWADRFPAFKENASQQLLIGACLYATIGRAGTALTTQYSASSTTACPIMFRRGTEKKEAKYGNNPYYLGVLFSTANPTSAAAKYLQMNLQPCTLSNASLLSMTCLNACSSFSGNPNFMLEPAADLTSAYNKCNSLASSGDKSNFIFAALEWANNMFQTWTVSSSATAASSDRLSCPAKGRGKRAVVVIVNKPDHFEPNEMTYLGFSDDYLEANLSTETIDFTKNAGYMPKSEREALLFSGASYGSGSYRCTSETTCTLTCAKKHNVKLVVAPSDTTTAGEITFTNVSNTSSTDKVKKDTLYHVLAEREFFIEKDNIDANSTITFKAKNLKFVSATITNRTINSGTAATCTKSESGNTVTITTNCERALNITVKQKDSWIQFGGDTTKRIITGEQELDLGAKTSNVSYTKQNVEIVKAKLKTESHITTAGEKVLVHYTEANNGARYHEKLPNGTKNLKFYSSNSSIDWSLNIEMSFSIISSDLKVRWDCMGWSLSNFGNYQSLGSGQTVILSSTSEYWTYLIDKSSSYIEITNFSCRGTEFTLTAIYDTAETTSTEVLISKNNYDPSPIKIPGGGQLLVTVKPKMDVQPSVSYTKLSGSTDSPNISGTQTITIYPKYTKSGNSYITVIHPTNVDISSIELADKMKIFDLNSETSARSGTGNVVLRNATGKEDPTEGAKYATLTACTKLASGTRLYFVKYKGSGSDADYAYLKTCAENTGGRMVSAENPTELKQKLDEISVEIKSTEFANASDAKIVR